ncbi:hypothetical protein BS50DRAFT_632843 [Corynespora cassiicola Philippines]|uniref:Uncharacterized protein n=1 Tax=Corynespora cassiicola Philippines TaxID=1448308 RepID=A0A2T2NUE2_CORCC|nr:hypothetical protein BS50DRAFT_632843 [Corynespora cassiicola Philippines]
MKFLRSCHKREPSEEEVPYPNIPIYAKKWPPPPDPDEISPANANLPSVADPTQQHQPETKQQEQANEDKPAYVPTHDPRPRFPEWGGWLAAVTRRVAIACHGITLGFVQVLRFENDLQGDNPAAIEAQTAFSIVVGLIEYLAIMHPRLFVPIPTNPCPPPGFPPQKHYFWITYRLPATLMVLFESLSIIGTAYTMDFLATRDLYFDGREWHCEKGLCGRTVALNATVIFMFELLCIVLHMGFLIEALWYAKLSDLDRRLNDWLIAGMDPQQQLRHQTRDVV